MGHFTCLHALCKLELTITLTYQKREVLREARNEMALRCARYVVKIAFFGI